MGAVDNFIHLFAPLTANCRDFDQRWARAGMPDSHGVAGCWEGEWISAVSGHSGRLRCVVEPLAAASWRMYFRGEYARFFRACYGTEFLVSREDGRWTFSGGSNLGALAGGEYAYSGYATLEQMVCTYRSAKDHGEFRLRKLAPSREAARS
jgi:hypothetical protein